MRRHATGEGDPSLAVDAPSPVYRFSAAELPGGELWVKDDGRLNPRYGGNKVRKLGRVLARAEREGFRRILTAGAAGSHHVLATTLFARERGLATAAVLGPQPFTEHAELTLTCALRWGLEPYPVRACSELVLTQLERRQRGDFLLPIGGWGVPGSLGFVDAAHELAAQVRAGALPTPDLIVVALGSGGTAAGLLAGSAAAGLDATLSAVSVFTRSAWAARGLVVPLAARLAQVTGQRVGWRALTRALRIDTAELGAGYGHGTAASESATAIGARGGLELDPTYTAKAFAAALRLLGCPEIPAVPAGRPALLPFATARDDRPLRVLYWHTLSAIPLGPLLERAPGRAAPSPALRSLFHRS